MAASIPPTFNNLFELVDPIRNQYIIPVTDLELTEPSVIRENEKNLAYIDGRRTIQLGGRPSGQGTNGPIAVFWAFSLDGKDNQGPFELQEERVSMVEIDERPWGILIEPLVKIILSVWISQ